MRSIQCCALLANRNSTIQMKTIINRIYTEEGFVVYGTYDSDVCMFTGDATLARVIEIIRQTEIGKEWDTDLKSGLYEKCQIEEEARELIEKPTSKQEGWFRMVTVEDGEVLR